MSKQLITNRQKVKNRIRSKIFWTESRPRLSVFRSLNFISAQLINDEKWSTICSASAKRSIDWAKVVWKEIATKAWSIQIVFDRNWYIYTGMIKALAESLRSSWLKF